ncbi:MAG: hypothetical protein C4335_09020 [Armatimonadota bacterium]
MRIIGIVFACVWVGILALPALSIGSDPRGAREADGLSREFDDATRLQQMQEAPKLPPPPLVTVPKPTPPPALKAEENSDPSALLQTNPASQEQAKQALQQAERDLQRERRKGGWHTAWQFTLWTGLGMAMTWAVWNWMLRRVSGGMHVR